jgi:hypothetical protein
MDLGTYTDVIIDDNDDNFRMLFVTSGKQKLSNY